MRDTPGISIRTLDVRDAADVNRFGQEAGPIDVLFNCAGFVHHGTILESTEADLDLAFDLNVKSMYRTITAFLPGMLEKGDGSIINMASVCGSVKGVPSRFVYGMSKAAVIGLTKAIAADYVTRGIRCNAICPGTVETPSMNDRLRGYRRLRQGAGGVYRAAADRPRGSAGGDRRSDCLSCYGDLHHRPDSHYRRGLDYLARNPKRLNEGVSRGPGGPPH